MTIHALIVKGVLVQDSRELEALHGHSLRKLPVRYPDLAYGGRPAVNVLLGSLISVHVTNHILSCDTTDCTIGMLNSQSFHRFSIFLDVLFGIYCCATSLKLHNLFCVDG